MSAHFRGELLAAAAAASFPPEKVWDPVAGKDRLEPDAEAGLQHLFELFGVTQLNPQEDDFNKVINTACSLALEVAAHVEKLGEAGGSLDAWQEAADWHPDYRAYISALWQGDPQAAAACAVKLHITQGIANGSPPLQDGPLA